MKNKGITEESLSQTMWIVLGVVAVILLVALALLYYGRLPVGVIFR